MRLDAQGHGGRDGRDGIHGHVGSRRRETEPQRHTLERHRHVDAVGVAGRIEQPRLAGGTGAEANDAGGSGRRGKGGKMRAVGRQHRGASWQ